MTGLWLWLIILGAVGFDVWMLERRRHWSQV